VLLVLKSLTFAAGDFFLLWKKGRCQVVRSVNHSLLDTSYMKFCELVACFMLDVAVFCKTLAVAVLNSTEQVKVAEQEHDLICKSFAVKFSCDSYA